MTRPPRWFNVLLRILPEPFRTEHADEIVDLAGRYAQDRTATGSVAIWARAAIDVLSVGLALRFRSVRRSREAKRDATLLDTLRQDLRYGLRSVRGDPGFAVFATLIVALGIGASVTVFSVVQSLLLRPLPFTEPDRLVWIANGEWGRGQQLSEISVQSDYVVDLRNGATQFEDVAGYHLFDRDGDHTLTRAGATQRVTRLRVTENLFSVLGLDPAHGRLFSADEAWDEGPAAILLTHAFWERAFGSSPDVVGSMVDIDAEPTLVVGVLPEAFDFPDIFAPGRRIDYIAPFPLSARSNRSGNTLGVIGRLAPGATVESAATEAVALAAQGDVVTDASGRRRNGFAPVVMPLREHLSGAFRASMFVLLCAVGLVMLIVCANLSNLLLARSATRRHELAVRAALGAARPRLIRQLMTESLLLSTAGAVLGVLLAFLGTSVVSGLDLRIPLLGGTRVDTTALVVAVAMSGVVGLLFGVAPALRGSDVRVHESLKDSARGSSASLRGERLRSALVVSEVALACLLLVASALMVRSLVRVLDVDLGYDATNVVAIRIDPSTRFAANEERVAFYSEALRRVRGAPGVASAGLTDVLPMGFNRRWDVRGTEEYREGESTTAFVRVASDGYVDAMGLSLMGGRDLLPTDGPSTRRVALVNERLARVLWPGEDPLGRTVWSSGASYVVVGVVRDTRHLSPEQDPGPEVFFSARQLSDQNAVHLVVRGSRSIDGLVETVRAELGAIDSSLPLDEVTSIQAILDASLAPRRFLVTLLAGFALFALTLASLGIYGVISYAVAQRRREIGIHIALGAPVRELRTKIVRETLGLAAVGLVLGIVGAVLVSRVLQSMLFGITGLDPIAYGSVVVTLASVACVAGYVPARRATLVNPLDSLSPARR